MDYSAANNGVWEFIILLGVLALALGIALVLRNHFAFIRKSMMPTAVLAGFLLLIARETGLIRLNSEILETLVYHSIALGFISMSLRKALRPIGKDGKREGRVTGFKSGAIIVGTYLVQAFAGLVISVVLSIFMPQLFQASGLLLPMGFGQGPGQANNIGATYESMGFAGGRSYGMAIAAAGYLCACTVGVWILKKWSGKPAQGSGRPNKKSADKNDVSMFQAPNEIPVSDSIDRFSVQIIMAFGTYLATFLLTRGLTSLVSAVSENLGNSVNTLLWGFNFIVGSAVAMLASKMMDFFQKKGTMVREYRNNYLLSRLSGLFFDLMITAGIASIKIEDISGLWVPFILTVTAGAVVTWFFLKWAAGHAYPAYRHEGLISMYGMLTGTIGSGILLLKEIDPDLETPAANNLVIGSSYGIALGAPLLIFISLAAGSTVMCLITLALIVIYGTVLSLIIRKK